jgi:Cyclin, N-terminal domain
MTSTRQHETAVDMMTLEAMQRQEKHYMCRDYLYQQEDTGLSGHRRFRLDSPLNCIDVACRTSMMQWMQTVVNFIGFAPETVEIAMNYLDRFLQKPAGVDAVNCRTVFQLSAMTALYLAVKINCSEALTPKLLAELSQGSYEAGEFENMEQIMLGALQWRVNPPTGASFVRETVHVLPEDLFANDEIRQTVMETARSQAEWVLGDYELISVKRSVVAFAAVANSLQHHGIQGFNLQEFLRDTLQNSNQNSLDLDLKQASLIKRALCEALPAGDNDVLSNETDNCQLEDSTAISLDGDNEKAPRKCISTEASSPRSVVYNV